jgi:hypothetical protein
MKWSTVENLKLLQLLLFLMEGRGDDIHLHMLQPSERGRRRTLELRPS